MAATNTKPTAAELFRKYADIVTEAKRPSEMAVDNAMYRINEDSNTLSMMIRDGWIDPESEILMIQAAKLLQQAVKISNSK
jgi:hypothetical protein